jgi:nucleotide-binding universal stress UspA family protein
MQTEPAGAGPLPFGNAFVGVDGTPRGRDAIALAEQLLAPGGRMTLANVVLVPSPIYHNFHATPVWKQRRAMLEREREAIGVAAELTGMFAASVGSGLHQLAEDYDADLLVVGSSGRGRVGRALGGDDARDTVSGATCPVAVAPYGYADHAGPIRIVGVGYDGSAEAKASLAVARELADATGARLVVLAVLSPVAGAAGHWEHADASGTFEQPAPDLLGSLEGVEGNVAVGAPASELVAFGDRVDLLVVGSRGHGPLRRLVLGSTSLPLTREARCPLLVIPRPAVAEYLPTSAN